MEQQMAHVVVLGAGLGGTIMIDFVLQGAERVHPGEKRVHVSDGIDLTYA